MTATDAYYIKLGTGGKWAKESIKHGVARIGWTRVPIDLIHRGDWAAIDDILRPLSKTPGAATSDLRALQRIVLSKPDDIGSRSTIHGCGRSRTRRRCGGGAARQTGSQGSRATTACRVKPWYPFLPDRGPSLTPKR
jgi:hypothetical protein